MVSGSEMKALKTVEKENGQTTTRLVSRQLGIDPSYATVLCTSLAKGNYLNRKTRGRFKITPKGRKALGWSENDQTEDMDLPVFIKPVLREEFHWRSVRTARNGQSHVPNGFSGVSHDDTAWQTMDYGRKNTWNRHSPGHTVSVLDKKNHDCNFCKGTGKKDKATCPICRGTGKISVLPPVVSCAYCRGKGIEKRTGRVCSVCRGKGLVSVRPPVTACGQCKGSGMESGTGLTCLKCSGKGVVQARNHSNRGVH
jgi:DNA-binding MarR family transcriptional regulator